MLIDTHTHLDSEAYFTDVAEVIDRALAAGVKRLLIPGADAATLPRAIELAERYDEVFFASGIHPYDIYTPASAGDFMLASLEHPKCLAIGECGLDYFRKPDAAEIAEQKRVFKRQCELAIEYDLPIILHVRDASEDVAQIVRSYPQLRGEFHCFNASPLLLEFSDRFYYGIGGVLTFKNARALVDILPRIPRERLLIETDSPYLTPHPFRGSRNESAYCTLVRDRIAELLGAEPSEIAALTSANAGELFKGLV